MLKYLIFITLLLMSFITNAGYAEFMSSERTSNGYVLAEMQVNYHLENENNIRVIKEDSLKLIVYSSNNSSTEMSFNTVISNSKQSVFNLVGVGAYTKGVESAVLKINGNFRKTLALTSDVYYSLGSSPLTGTLTIKQNGRVSELQLTFPRPE